MSAEQKPDIAKWLRVTEVLRLSGVADFSGIRNIEFYLDRGSDIHLICESIDKGEPNWWSDGDLWGYANAWQKFKDDTGFNPELIEHPVYHEQRRYKGTLDRTGKFGSQKERILLDIKSGIVAAWTPLQTAAYAACLERPEEIHRYGLQLMKSGDYRLSPKYADYRTDSNTFFALLAAVNAKSLYGHVTIVEGE